MQTVNCNFCGQDNADLVNEGPDLQLNRPERFRLVKCRSCGLIYQNPQLSADELLTHYPDTYQRYNDQVDDSESSLVRADKRRGMVRRCVRVEKRHPTKGHVLDVGCATGDFLAVMVDRGWQATGVELSPFASAVARQHYNLDVFTGLLEDAAFPDDHFDVVTMWDVFEHVTDPKATLSEVRRILKPGGLFVASTPNAASLEAKLFGPAWAGWDRPRHLHVFNPKVLSDYALAGGFGRIEIISFSGRLGVFLLSLGYWLTDRGISEVRWRRGIDFLYNPIFRAISLPFYWLLEHLNQTTNMTLFAQKI